jgi:hypothetical protein
MKLRAIELDDTEPRDRTPLDRLPDTVLAIVATVRAVYCNAVRMTGKPRLRNFGSKFMKSDEVVVANGTPTRSEWEKLAIHLINLRASPELYIRSQFEAHLKNRNSSMDYPPVRMLYSGWAVDNWERYSKNRETQVLWQLQSDRTQLNVNVLPLVTNLQWPTEDAVEYALGDRIGCVITPFTRYCVAYKNGIHRIAEESFNGALFQYLFEVAFYDNICSDGIPEPLRVTARNVRRHLGLY